MYRPYTREHLIGWLERQPPDKAYEYADRDNCLNAQYRWHCGFFRWLDYQWRGLIANNSAFWVRLEHGVAAQDPRTFGAALERARQLTDA